MINPERGFLGKHPVHFLNQIIGGCPVTPERFLNHHPRPFLPRPARDHPGIPQRPRHLKKYRRRHRHIKQPVRIGTPLDATHQLEQIEIGIHRPILPCRIITPPEKLRRFLRAGFTGRIPAGQMLRNPRSKLIMAHWRARHPVHMKISRKITLAIQRKQRWNDLPLGQITRRPDNHNPQWQIPFPHGWSHNRLRPVHWMFIWHDANLLPWIARPCSNRHSRKAWPSPTIPDTTHIGNPGTTGTPGSRDMDASYLGDASARRPSVLPLGFSTTYVGSPLTEYSSSTALTAASWGRSA